MFLNNNRPDFSLFELRICRVTYSIIKEYCRVRYEVTLWQLHIAGRFSESQMTIVVTTVTSRLFFVHMQGITDRNQLRMSSQTKVNIWFFDFCLVLGNIYILSGHYSCDREGTANSCAFVTNLWCRLEPEVAALDIVGRLPQRTTKQVTVRLQVNNSG